MNRRDYYALASAKRHAHWRMSGSERHFDMADSRLMVQHTSQAESIVRMRARIAAITQQLPACRDPKGVRIMAQNWARRRSHVLAALKRDAMIARDDRKYARMHDAYFAHQKALRYAA